MTSFEEKMEQLEASVIALEKGDVPLQEAIDKYVEAMKLAKECEEELTAARDKVVKVIDEEGRESNLED